MEIKSRKEIGFHKVTLAVCFENLKRSESNKDTTLIWLKFHHY